MSGSKTKYPKVLVSGAPGTGKTLLADFLSRSLAVYDAYVIDLDTIGGRHFATNYGKSNTWLVLDRHLALLEEISKYRPVVALGNCSNITRDVVYYDPSSKDTLLSRKATKSVDRSLDWDLKIWLWYEPSERERRLRFSSARMNNYGKEPFQWDSIRSDLERTRGSAPDGFRFWDVSCFSKDPTLEFVEYSASQLKDDMDFEVSVLLQNFAVGVGK